MQQVDGYCERIGPDFWAEPLNAVTNLAFLLAAYALRRHLATVETISGTRDPQSSVLIVILWAIGLGSLAFHTFATIWAIWFITTKFWILIFCAHFWVPAEYKRINIKVRNTFHE